MNAEPIKSERDHQRALKEIKGLMMAKHSTPEGDRLDVQVRLVENWEAEHHPLDQSEGAG